MTTLNSHTLENRVNTQSHHKQWHFKHLKSTLVVSSLLIMSTLSNTALADDDDEKSHGVCSQIATLAFAACKHDVKDDFLINKANCLNTDDREEKRECLLEARMQLHEEKEICGEQREARVEVCEAIGFGPYLPEIDPALFVSADMSAGYFLWSSVRARG